MKPPALVEVVWLDARSYYERITWSEIGSRCRLALQHTVGYLHSQDAEVTRIAHTFDPCEGGEEPDAVDVTVIPTGWIKTLRYVRPKRKAKPNDESPEGS